MAPPSGGLHACLHLLTPQVWPFAPADGNPPWDLTPKIPNGMSDPMLLFARIAKASYVGESNRSTLGLALLIGIVGCSLIMLESWTRARVGSSRSRPRWSLIVVSSALFFALGYLDAWRGMIDPRLRFYPVFPDFLPVARA